MVTEKEAPLVDREAKLAELISLVLQLPTERLPGARVALLRLALGVVEGDPGQKDSNVLIGQVGQDS